MNTSKHLDISEIMAFRNDLLSDADRHAAAKHLIRCGNCRSHLPAPSPEQFWTSILGEEDLNTESESSSSVLKESFFRRIPWNISAVRPAVFASILFVALAGLSGLMLFGRLSSDDDKMVAGVTETGATEVLVSPSGLPIGERRSEQFPNDGETEAVKRSAQVSPLKDGRLQKTQSYRKEDRSGTDKRFKNEPTRSQRAETRGSTAPCGGQTFVGLDTRTFGSGVRLSWDKVAGAVLYRIYVSDLDERLLDQFETASDTSYTVADILDPDSVYRWTLIVKLKNGQTISGTSQNFRVRDLGSGESRQEQISKGKKTAASVRCVENKQ